MPKTKESSNEAALTLDSELIELERLRTFVDDFSSRTGLPEQTRDQLNIALEELVVNAITHGECAPREGAIRLSIGIEGGEVRMVLSDTGMAFDPLQAPPPDLTRDVLSRPVGGLGIHLVRRLIPGMHYKRRDGRNYLYMTKPIRQQGVSDASRPGGSSR